MGFRVAERFAADHGIDLAEERFDGRFGMGEVQGHPVGVLLPQTFMNRSGESVAEAVATLPVEDPSRDLLLVVDDVDLPLGRIRLRASGGDGGHRGLADAILHLERRDFPRLRFGVDRPPGRTDTTDWVLASFGPAEEEVLARRVAEAARAVEAALTGDLSKAMSRYNRDPEADGTPPSPP